MDSTDIAQPTHRRSEYYFVGLVVLCLLSASAVSSTFKPFWFDELISHTLITSPSTSHMLEALGNAVDSLPPLYFLVARVWSQLFGASEISLRLLSSLSLAAAFAITWRVGRKYFSFWAVSFGTTAAFCLSGTLVHQNTEARCYGILVLLGSLCLRQSEKFVSRDDIRPIDLALNAVLHACLVLTHLFGFIYSASFQLGLFGTDLLRGRFRPRVYASGFLGWIAYLLWLPSFIRQTEFANPRWWQPVPTLIDLRESFGNNISLGLVLAVLVIVAVIRISANEERKVPILMNTTENTCPLVLVSAFVVLLPPLAAWVVSRLVVPLFLDRYFLPGIIGWAMLLSMVAQFAAEPLTGHAAKGDRAWPRFAVAWGVVLLMALVPVLLVVHKVQWRGFQISGIHAPRGLPVVAESAHAYLLRCHYDKERTWFFVLDREVALDDGSPLGASTENVTMANLKKYFPYYNIEQSAEFLRKHDRFLVLRDHRYQWFEKRILRNESYRTTDLGLGLVLVEHSR